MPGQLLERTLVVGTGGFLGAAARYLLGGLVYRWLPATFPWATFLINVTGCFGIGFLAVLAEERMLLGPAARLFLMVGILGGYTTFSTFAQEGLSLFEDGRSGVALAYMLGSVVTGLLAVYAGTRIGRLI